MKKEFITTNGKVIIENDILQIKKLIYRSDYDSFSLFILIYAIYLIDKDSTPKVIGYVLLVIGGLMALLWIIETFFINTLKKKFPLQSIKSYKINKDNFGLETDVIIYLKSGRQKKITFRNLEHQMEPFLETITQYITQPQTVH